MTTTVTLTYNDPINLTDPTGLTPQDADFNQGPGPKTYVVDDLVGAMGTNPGTGRVKNNTFDFTSSMRTAASPWNVGDYTDEIWNAAKTAGIDTRLVYAAIAKETERGLESQVTDEWARNHKSKGVNPGPGNIQEGAFNEVMSRHGDVLGGHKFWDVVLDKQFAADVTAFRLADLDQDLNGAIVRKGVHRITQYSDCSRPRDVEPDAHVFCRSSLITSAYVKVYSDTIGGKYFDEVFTRGRIFNSNSEFETGSGVTNGATKRAGGRPGRGVWASRDTA